MKVFKALLLSIASLIQEPSEASNSINLPRDEVVTDPVKRFRQGAHKTKHLEGPDSYWDLDWHHICRGAGDNCKPIAANRYKRVCRRESIWHHYRCRNGNGDSLCGINDDCSFLYCDDGFCTYGHIDTKCNSSSNCESGFCVDGKCQGGETGDKCYYPTDCKSTFCVVDLPGNKHRGDVLGKCTNGGQGSICSSLSECNYIVGSTSTRVCYHGFCQNGTTGKSCKTFQDCSLPRNGAERHCHANECQDATRGSNCVHNSECYVPTGFSTGICVSRSKPPLDISRITTGCYYTNPTAVNCVCQGGKPGDICEHQDDCLPLNGSRVGVCLQDRNKPDFYTCAGGRPGDSCRRNDHCTETNCEGGVCANKRGRGMEDECTSICDYFYENYGSLWAVDDEDLYNDVANCECFW